MKLIFILYIGILLISCSNPERQNPFDPKAGNYHPPKVSLMSDTIWAINDTLRVVATVTDSACPIISYKWVVTDSIDTIISIYPYLDLSWSDAGSKEVQVWAVDTTGVSSINSDTCVADIHVFRPYFEGTKQYEINLKDSITFTIIPRDTNGTVSEVLWALDGENYANTGTSVKTAFEVHGEKKVLIKCVDDDSVWSNVDTVVVSVTEDAPNLIVPENISVNLKDSLTLIVSGEDNGTIISYWWALDGTNFSEMSNSITTAFDTHGQKDVLVKCIDDDSVWSDINTIKVDVTEDAPVLTKISDTIVGMNDSVTIRIIAEDTNSTGSIVSYLWDLENDGVWNSEMETNSITLWGTGGWEKLIIGVKDDDGVIGTDTVMILFNRPPNAPSLLSNSLFFDSPLTWECTDPDTGQTISFYKVEIGVDKTSLSVVYNGKNSSYKPTGLESSTKYEIRITAYDSFGDSTSTLHWFQTSAFDLEPANNIRETAPFIAAGAFGNVSSSDGEDWYHFYLEQSGTITLNIENLNGKIGGTYLYEGTSYNSLASLSSYSSGTSDTETIILQGGRNYYININSAGTYAGQYKFLISYQNGLVTKDIEPTNNERTSAPIIYSGELIEGCVTSSDEEDLYKFTLSTTSSVTLNIENLNGKIGGTYLYEGTSYNSLASLSSYSSGTSDTETIILQGGKTYYININAAGTYTGQYRLQLLMIDLE